ncbi:hypothetical protein HanPSC8_Chr16g0707231 [Helianthus annuus]|nr:hypothetical protein HanPSC8_Chr16g0707231 [Helianthus annuus]
MKLTGGPSDINFIGRSSIRYHSLNSCITGTFMSLFSICYYNMVRPIVIARFCISQMYQELESQWFKAIGV